MRTILLGAIGGRLTEFTRPANLSPWHKHCSAPTRNRSSRAPQATGARFCYTNPTPIAGQYLWGSDSVARPEIVAHSVGADHCPSRPRAARLRLVRAGAPDNLRADIR